MRASQKHRIPGTAARTIARNQRDPDAVTIILVWRSVVMPPDQQREAALVAFCADLDDVFAWETAVRSEHHVLLHA